MLSIKKKAAGFYAHGFEIQVYGSQSMGAPRGCIMGMAIGV